MNDWGKISGSEPFVPDQCSARTTFSIARFLLFTLVFIIMIPGSSALFIILKGHPYGIQFASVVAYTSAVILYTFSRNRGLQRYLFSCPVVRRTLPRLVLRHFGFVIALFVLETFALEIRPHLSAYWSAGIGGSRNMPPFIAVLSILCGALALIQIFTNRSLLDRAHCESASADGLVA